MALCAAGFAFDLLEMALGGALAAVFSAPPVALERGQLAWLLASVYIGAVVGAPAFGWLADRVGRRLVMSALLVVLAATSMLAALSETPLQLGLWRGLSGLALGAFPALMITYLTDVMPARSRATLILAVVAVASLGAPAGMFLVRELSAVNPLGFAAWRWGFVAGAVGAGTVAVVMWLWLPESPRWLVAKGRTEEAEAAIRRFTALDTIETAPAPREQARAVPATRAWATVALLFFASPWSTVAFPLLVGAVLIHRGFQLQDTLLFVAVSNFGPVLGAILGALGIDRLERRSTLAGCATLMLLSGAGFVWASTPAAVMLCATAFTLAAALYVPSLSVYGAELFPTTSRASAFGSAWTFNRIGAATAPLVLLPLLQSSGSDALMLVVGASLLSSLILLMWAPPGKTRRAVA
jgi:putative MFS transporter